MKVHNFHHHQRLSIWFFSDIFCSLLLLLILLLLVLFFICSPGVALCLSFRHPFFIPSQQYNEAKVPILRAKWVSECLWIFVSVLLLRVETSFNISPTSVCARVLYIMVLCSLWWLLFVDVIFYRELCFFPLLLPLMFSLALSLSSVCPFFSTKSGLWNDKWMNGTFHSRAFSY